MYISRPLFILVTGDWNFNVMLCVHHAEHACAHAEHMESLIYLTKIGVVVNIIRLFDGWEGNMAGCCTLVLYFHLPVACENTVAHLCNIQPYCLLRLDIEEISKHSRDDTVTLLCLFCSWVSEQSESLRCWPESQSLICCLSSLCWAVTCLLYLWIHSPACRHLSSIVISMACVKPYISIVNPLMDRHTNATSGTSARWAYMIMSLMLSCSATSIQWRF